MGAVAIGALVGAGMGAGASALTGSDPLKGALMGALGGAIMPGAGGLLGGAEAGGLMGAARGIGQTAARAFPTTAELAASSAARAAPTTIGRGTSSGVFSINAPGLDYLGGAGTALNPSVGTSAMGNAARIAPETGLRDVFSSTPEGLGFYQKLGNYIVQNPKSAAAIGGGLSNMMFNTEDNMPKPWSGGDLSRFDYDPEKYRVSMLAEGGIAGAMQPSGYPQPQPGRFDYMIPREAPTRTDEGIAAIPTSLRYASGGRLGGYSDGGSLLKGPGDGMSDSIPAKIGARQPARLADGEFVVPADVVSHLGNGSTDAGAKQLYAMMDKVRRARTGNKRQGRTINARKMLPA